jgi:thioredoxin 1
MSSNSSESHPADPKDSKAKAESKAESKVVELDDGNFEQQVLRSPVPVLVDFTAAWCAPCRSIAPYVEAIAAAYVGRARVGKYDVDDNQTWVAKLDIRSMPTLLMFKDGKVLGQVVGASPRAKIEAMVTNALLA